MQTPDDVQAMLKLASLGWGGKRISRELGCSRNTERSYLRQGGRRPYQQPQRPGRLTSHREWLADRFRQHRGNCDAVRQEQQREHGVRVSLRTVERAVAHLRGEVIAQTVATVRFETPPGHQTQIGFGRLRVALRPRPGVGSAPDRRDRVTSPRTVRRSSRAEGRGACDA